MTEPGAASGAKRQKEVEIDPDVAHAARVYDYLLGGTTNFESDRAAAAHAVQAVGGLDNARADVRANRDFLGRAVHHVAAEAGIRQFLDIGTGIPGDDNTHAVAQRVAPEARVVYVDNDPIVLAHAHQLLAGASPEVTAYLDGDLRRAGDILEQAAATLDLGRPVALVLVAILHFLGDDEDPYAIVSDLLDAVPSGSYLVASHMANDIVAGEMDELADRLNRSVRETFVPRNHRQVARFFTGLEMVEPGLVPVDDWPVPAARPPGAWVSRIYGGVGRKP